jgi:hypothetical protein
MWARFAGDRGFFWQLIMAGRKIMADLYVSNSSGRERCCSPSLQSANPSDVHRVILASTCRISAYACK